MGTNYYAHVDGDRLHLTKTSGGWKPALHWHPDRYTTPDEFFDFVMDPSVTIVDEYGRTWSKRLFVEKVRRWVRENDRTHDPSAYYVEAIRGGYQFHSGEWS